MAKRALIVISLIIASIANGQTTAQWSYSQRESEEGKVDLIFKVNLERPWYIYSATESVDGVSPLSFELLPSNSYEAIGTLKDVGEPKKRFDQAFKKEMLFFEGEATYIQTIRVNSNEPFKVKGTLIFQTCNGEECLSDEIDLSFDIKGTATPPVEEGGGEGLLKFLLIAIAAGIGALFTPCVFPMIPMTVSFFIGGGATKREGVTKGAIFTLSVTLIYTLLGVIVALFQSTDATDLMGSHWIPNLLFALLFITFAISFFGAFEITLPSGLANRADAKADKGGYIAAFFVALAMVIVSFSCTGPFVGSILAAAVTGGVALKPILGMAAFGFAFAFPFMLFSLFPSLMKSMPKSGGWLNIVKVIFAFVLLAFSLKFLSSVDLYFGWGILSRALFISLWIAIAALMGLYLLGKIRTHNDSETPTLGTFRILMAIASFAFAIYLIPGLFGAPLNSFSSLLPPQDGSTLVISSNSSSNQGSAIVEEVSEGLCGEAKYATAQNRAPYSLKSYYEIEQAIECAKEVNRPLLLSFKAVTCSACKVMEANVWSRPEVLELIRERVVLVTLYVDDRRELPKEEQVISTLDSKVKDRLGRKLRDYQLTKFGVASQPYYVLIDHNENLLTEPVGECSAEKFISFLEKGIEAFYN